MSPETLYSRVYSEKSDVWAFGVTLYEIVVSRELYGNLPLVQIATQVANKSLKLKIPDGIPILSDLINNCLEYEVDERPTFIQVVERLEALAVNNRNQWIMK